MADPFRAEIFDSVIAKIIDSVDRNPRTIRLIYSNPVEGGRIERTGRARLVRLGRRKGRPWTTAPDLAMYEIGHARGSSERPARPLPRRLRRPAARTATGAAQDRPPEQALLQARSDASGTRVVLTGESGELESLRAAFERDHCVRLRDFLSAPLLDRIRAYADEGDKAGALLFLLLNDAELFKLVRTITACRRIRPLRGRPRPDAAGPRAQRVLARALVREQRGAAEPRRAGADDDDVVLHEF